MTNERVGVVVRFFDEHERERGRASKVVKRERAPGRLIVLDVTEPDRALLSFLRSLDRSPLRVQQTGTAGESYAFAWASGYKDGPTVRIQGVLHDA